MQNINDTANLKAVESYSLEKQKKGEKGAVSKKIFIPVMIIAILLSILLVVVIISTNKLNEIQKEGATTPEKSNLSKRIEVEKVTESNKVMDIKEDASGDKVPVPKGYVGSSVDSEREIDTGYVIYEGTEEVTYANLETAQTTRNQYVWVPVPDASKVYGIDSNGKLWGKLYDFSGTSSSPNNWSETADGLININNGILDREPDLLGAGVYDKEKQLKQYGLEAESRHEFKIELEKEFSQAIYSIEKYGGFYIGRYETGNLSQNTVVVKKGNTDIASQTWYTMYEKCKRLANANVNTSMIWGNMWDATLNWMLTSENESVKTFVTNSTGKGNYGTYARKATGSNEDYSVNNIYDMAGNVYDWTLETHSNYARLLRGGNHKKEGSNVPACSRSYWNEIMPYQSDNFTGCRAVLYV